VPSPPRAFAPRPLLATFLFTLAACQSPPSASSLREWTAKDHDRIEESARATKPGGRSERTAATAAGQRAGSDAVLEASWTQQCAQCHGRAGHGDGPTGPMVHAADLTRDDWQATVTDAQIAAVIVAGKGKMPAFPNLPEKIISGFVARIRAYRGR